jgi:hypothetical protein
MMTAPAPRNFAARWLAPLAALAMLGGCVATPMADVTRFHLGQPVPAASISIVPIKAMEHILEYRSYAEAVAPEFTRIGFTPVPNDGLSTYIGVLKVEQTSREGEISRSPITVGIGGGSFGGGGGIGGGISLPRVARPAPCASPGWPGALTPAAGQTIAPPSRQTARAGPAPTPAMMPRPRAAR